MSFDVSALFAVNFSLSTATKSISSLEHRIARIKLRFNLLDHLEPILETFNAKGWWSSMGCYSVSGMLRMRRLAAVTDGLSAD